MMSHPFISRINVWIKDLPCLWKPTSPSEVIVSWKITNIVNTIACDAVAGGRHIAIEEKCFLGLELPIRRPTKDNEIVNNALKSSNEVNVFQHRRAFGGFGRLLFYGFEPRKNAKGVGIIIYPGSLVDVKAYAPIAKRMAENGYHAAMVTPPISISSLDWDLADQVINFKWKDDVQVWAVSGHSQGGAISCTYANRNRGKSVKGVVLLAAYARDSSFLNGDLSDSGYNVVSIYGSVDGIALYEDVVLKGAKSLPPNAKFVKIEGGNHSQFSYVEGLQVTGDKTGGQPQISLKEQQDIICEEILSLLAEISP